jgi:archaellum component FlaC
MKMKLIDIIKEQSLGYTPEGIDSIIREASEFLQTGFVFYKNNYEYILSLTIGECINDIENLKERLKRIQQVKNRVEQKYDKYFNIVDTFDLGNYPDNVKRLEAISNQLDNLSMSLGDISDALDGLLDSAKYLSKHKQ